MECPGVDKNIVSKQGKLHAESRWEKASKKPLFLVVSVDCLWITVWKRSQTASGCGPLADQVGSAPNGYFLTPDGGRDEEYEDHFTGPPED